MTYTVHRELKGKPLALCFDKTIGYYYDSPENAGAYLATFATEDKAQRMATTFGGSVKEQQA